MAATNDMPVEMMTTREKIAAGIEVTKLEKIDVKIEDLEKQIADARENTTHWQRERKRLTDECYALVKAREFLEGTTTARNPLV
jgi:hypothetical protein